MYINKVMIVFGLRCCMDWLAEANVLEKRAISIFRAQLISWHSEGPYIYIEWQKTNSDRKSQLGW
jgi:hypothetical protein